MDYIYTSFHKAHTDGTPVVQPLWFKYPKDAATFPIDLQFFYGDSILVSPVTDENSTSVSAYFPKDIFYDFATLKPLQGTGSAVTLSNISFTDIPVHIRGGSILPLRVESAMTTTALRTKDFEFVVAPGSNGKASGSLYIDDGVSIAQSSSTSVIMSYGAQTLAVTGSFGFATGVNVQRVRVLGVQKRPALVLVNAKKATFTYSSTTKVLDVAVGLPLDRGFIASFV